MTPVAAYPLAWPVGWKRTAPHERRRAKFGRPGYYTDSGTPSQKYVPPRLLTMAEATSRTLDQLRMMGVSENDRVISTNVRLRLDGVPRSDQPQPGDCGVAVYWLDATDQRRCMAVDHYDRVEDNLAAIAATLEAMRAIERHGGAAILERAFTGFTALPAPVTGQKPWREVLGVGPGVGQSSGNNAAAIEAVRDAYRRKRGEAHPDREGGTDDAFVAVTAAYEAAQRELGFHG